jgi:cytochrome c oxidase subunit II
VAGTDLTILIAYGVVVLLAVLVSLAVVVSTRNRRPLDTHRLAEFEKQWLAIVVAILVALLVATIWFTPYGKSTPSNAQVVQVSARQFFWQLKPSTVRVGVPVAFVTRASDVNHGFGIYRGHKFIAQIQVVPDRNSTLIHTFHQAGTYTVLCLEFCGVGHQAMTASFRVTK